MGALTDGRVEIPTNAVVEGEAGGEPERVLQEGGVVLAIDGGRADVLAAGKVRGRNCDGICEGTAGKEARERIGQQVAGSDVVRAAFGGDELGSVGGASTKIVFAVGTDAEVRGVAIEEGLKSGFEGVAAGGPGEKLTALEEISIDLDHRARRRIEGLEKAVVEADCGVGVVGGWESRSGASDADGGKQSEARRDGARISAIHVSLPVDVGGAEGGIDGGLVGIGGWTGEIVD